MKGRYPIRPFMVPALVVALTATGLVAALLNVATGLLLFVVSLIVVRLGWRARPSSRRGKPDSPI